MTDEQWLRVESIVAGVAGRDAGERTTFLDEACAGDDRLRRDVESLLRFESDAERFLERSAMEEAVTLAAADVLLDDTPIAIDGYEIGAFIGAGGMGDVYRARDVRLDRDVALKIIRHEAGDVAPTTRFEEEARSASRLNHPNIVTVHAVGSQGNVSFIVMELVTGRTLRDRLAAGPLPFTETLDIAAQLADGLAAAHAMGVVHRDLKPENVMVTSGGLVKILDFGIARRGRTRAEDPRRGAPTETVRPIPATSLAGTAGYMSPEQAARGAVDHRSDQFSFGAIVHEMVSVPGADPRVSTALSAVVERCVQARPGDRYASTRDLARDVRRIHDNAVHDTRWRPTRRQAIAAVSTVVAAGAATAWGIGYGSGAIRRLAVLPFVNDSGDESTDILCDGITEVLIRQLSRAKDLAVIGRGTAFQFKGTERDPRDIGKQLDVQGVLHGSMSERGGRLVVDVELVDARTGVRIWGDQLNRSASDVLAIQNEIAATIITDGLGRSLSTMTLHELPGVMAADQEAYRLFLEAVHRLRGGTETDYLAARTLLEDAVTRDRTFALAHLTLASTYSVMAVDGYEDPREAWPLSRMYVDRALEQDPGLPDAHAERAAEAFFFRRDWAEAQREWDQALQSRRSEVQGELLTAYVLQQWALGRNDVALKFARAAHLVDPLSPMLAVREADVLAAMGDLSSAADRYIRIIENVSADTRAAYSGLAHVRQRQARFDDAIEAWRLVFMDADDELRTVVAAARGRDGCGAIERYLAMRELEGLADRSASGDYVSPLDEARAHARLRHDDEAFACLETAFTHTSAGLVFLNVDPAWDNLRHDRRFDNAVRRVGLVQHDQRG